MEKNVRENIYMCGCVYIYKWIILLYSRNIVNQYSFLKRSIWLEGQKAVPYIGGDWVIWAQRHPPHSASNPSLSGTVRPRVFHRDVGAAQLIWFTLMYQASTWSGWAWVEWIRLATSPVSLSTPRCGWFDSVSGPGWEGGTTWSMKRHCVPLMQVVRADVGRFLFSCTYAEVLRHSYYKSLDKLGDGICNPRVKILSVTRVKQWEF